MLVSVTGLPATLEQYVDYTPVDHSGGRFEVRCRTFPSSQAALLSGSLIWQFNDCWPGISWSLIDYYGFAKASYFYVRRAYAPVMASFKTTGDGAVELWIVNDTLNSIDTEVEIGLKTFGGGTVWSESIAASVEENGVEIVWRAQGKRLAADRRHVLTVHARDNVYPANRHFFVPIKDLDRPSPACPRNQGRARGAHEIAVHLSTSDYLCFLFISLSPTNGLDSAITIFSIFWWTARRRRSSSGNEAVALSRDDVAVVRWR